MRLLLWLALAVAVFWLLRPKRTNNAVSDKDQSVSGAMPAPAERMIQCRQCGIYLPASDAVQGAGGEAYCCDAHRIAHTQA